MVVTISNEVEHLVNTAEVSSSETTPMSGSRLDRDEARGEKEVQPFYLTL